ncbi:MAG: HNH endonuclease [Armatimonadota bacterium]
MSVGDNIIVTRNVEKRLMKQAQAAVPFDLRARLIDYVSPAAVVLFVAGPIAYNVLDLDFGVDGTVLLAGWSLGLLGAFSLVDRISQGALIQRFALVRGKLQRLADQRMRQIAEAEAFYASAEWKLLRDEVVREQGRRCRDCGATISVDGDVTVDHILPRSTYPHASLSKENLRVLCRSCNSRKRDREPG